MPGKGKLSYTSKEQCIADARRLKMDASPCQSLPSASEKRVKGASVAGADVKKSNTNDMPKLGKGMSKY
tara:strand:- start:68 stop:274 length:207 start_codon:yes stop_codon:yes gene_type:complete